MSQTPFNSDTPRSLFFRIIAGPRTGQSLEINAKTAVSGFLIGRIHEAAIFIDTTDVSRRHAQILQEADGFYYIHDLGSRNGTQVDGKFATVKEPIRLVPGSTITIGSTKLVFEGIFGNLKTERLLEQNTVVQNVQLNLEEPALSSEIRRDLPPEAVLILSSTGQRFPINQPELTVGRTSANQIMIDAKSISRHHARFQKSNAGYLLTDLGSTNKTYVNNNLVSEAVILKNGDKIRFGDVDTVFLVVALIPSLKEEIEIEDEDATDFTNPDNTNLMEFRGYKGDYKRNQSGNLLPLRNLEHGETKLNLNYSGTPNETPFVPSAKVNTTSSDPLSGPKVKLVQLENVCKKLELQNTNLSLGKGEIIIIAGNGATTLLNILAVIEIAEKGKVQILGRNLPTLESFGKRKFLLDDDKELAQWRKTNIGFLPLSGGLNMRQTVFENVAAQMIEKSSLTFNSEKVWEQLYNFKLANPEFKNSYPADLTDNERQKLALARTMASHPSILLLSEPAQTLQDADLPLLIEQLKTQSNEGKGIIIISKEISWLHELRCRYEVVN